LLASLKGEESDPPSSVIYSASSKNCYGPQHQTVCLKKPPFPPRNSYYASTSKSRASYQKRHTSSHKPGTFHLPLCHPTRSQKQPLLTLTPMVISSRLIQPSKLLSKITLPPILPRSTLPPTEESNSTSSPKCSKPNASSRSALSAATAQSGLQSRWSSRKSHHSRD